ncbi:hypothetical protein NC652_012204 [Populus alba x Populus x berolinensis]|uniref:Uncharacterized protein n=1 Tax=Populus alba x Populus x berolinensis TaxID=444605 RepID=A0AAD6R4G1_9ROSI|nr:hypothetical protein NC652_012204 [Populus alba x Populus x berolinensis]KAJ7002161.1 hypothetical protein NC653_012277 [Populus alba x Populus x berolinensis]
METNDQLPGSIWILQTSCNTRFKREGWLPASFPLLPCSASMKMLWDDVHACGVRCSAHLLHLRAIKI